MANNTWNYVSNRNFGNFDEAKQYASNDWHITSVASSRYNCCLSDKAKQAVSYEDFCAMIARVMYTIDYFCDSSEIDYDSISYSAIADNVTLWANNKANKILAMKSCKLYNENNPYKLIIPATYERITDRQPIINLATAYRSDMYVDSFLSAAIIALDSAKLTSDMIAIYNNLVSKEISTEFLKKIKDIHPHEGQKTSRFIRKLITAINGGLATTLTKCKDMEISTMYYTDAEGKPMTTIIGKATINSCRCGLPVSIMVSGDATQEAGDYKGKLWDMFWEKLFAQYADGINPTVFTRPTVLSLDYVDYLLMSNGTGWNSCHWINKEDASAGGCNSGGTWSYANDAVSYIMYTVDESVTSDFELAPKITREVVIYDDVNSQLVCDRIYPQSNDSGATNLYTEHRQCAQKFISEIYGYANFWNTWKFPGSRSYTKDEYGGFKTQPNVRTHSDACQYEDYSYFPSSVSVPKEIITAYNATIEPDPDTGVQVYNYMFDHDEITVGDVAYCPKCGSNIRDEGDTHFICADCVRESERSICEECGDQVYEEDLRYCPSTEQWLCDDCCFYDDILDEYVANTEGSTTVYGRGCDWTTSDNGLGYGLRHNMIYKCENCGEYFIKDQIPPVEDNNGNYYCKDCAEEVFETCAECGCYELRDDMTKVEGKWYCDYCAQGEIERLKEKTGEDVHPCCKCHSFEKASNTHIVYRHNANGAYEVHVCDHCYERVVRECPVCGRDVLEDDITGFSSFINASACSYECLKEAVETRLSDEIKLYKATGGLSNATYHDTADAAVEYMWNNLMNFSDHRVFGNNYAEFYAYCESILF